MNKEGNTPTIKEHIDRIISDNNLESMKTYKIIIMSAFSYVELCYDILNKSLLLPDDRLTDYKGCLISVVYADIPCFIVCDKVVYD